MTNPTDNRPPPIPGQMDLVPDPPELMAEELRLRADLDRLDSLRRESVLRALSALGARAADWRNSTESLDESVAAARSAGATWQQIADAVGIQRQSAWKRWAQ